MIITKKDRKSLKRSDFATLPDIKTGFVRDEIDGETGLRLVYLKNPSTQGDDSMTFISHSIAAMEDDRLIFVASIESLDLRELAIALSESLKNLQNDYNAKGYFTEPHMVLYGNGDKEDIGRYLGAKDDETIFDFLRGLFEDTFVEESDDEDYSAWLY